MTRLKKVRSRTRSTTNLGAIEQIPSPLANDNVRIAIEYVAAD